jgi:ATPase subunit of ABC transporter with duplicated ATPase domains
LENRRIDLIDPAFLLTKSFGERVLLDNVTWQISQGERVGLCGPNGAGKTTLLKMLAGLDEPDAGASSSRTR